MAATALLWYFFIVVVCFMLYIIFNFIQYVILSTIWLLYNILIEIYTYIYIYIYVIYSYIPIYLYIRIAKHFRVMSKYTYISIYIYIYIDIYIYLHMFIYTKAYSESHNNTQNISLERKTHHTLSYISIWNNIQKYIFAKKKKRNAVKHIVVVWLLYDVFIFVFL